MSPNPHPGKNETSRTNTPTSQSANLPRAKFDPSQWLHDYVHRPDFVQKYPYYAFILASMKVVADPAVQVMGVSANQGRFYLHVNIDFFATRPQFLAGVLLHEVHHVVLGHITEPRFRGCRHADLMDLAMEMSANEFIHEKLPLTPILWPDYAPLGIQRGQSTLERYEILVRAREQGETIELGETLDDHIPNGVAIWIDQSELDPAGLGAGTTHEDVQEILRDMVEKVGDYDQVGMGPQGPRGRLAGTDPGTLMERLQPVDEARELERSWQTAIQMFVRLLRVPFHTFSRPNRRFPELVGQVAGRLYSQGVADKPRLLLAIDTSASMTSAELNVIARQFRPLSKMVKITVVECDSSIHRVYPFNGTLDSVYGRGGTDFHPLFAPRLLETHRPQGIIIFTDGDGPYPINKPPIKTLWVLTKPHEFNCPWGERVWLRTESSAGTTISPSKK